MRNLFLVWCLLFTLLVSSCRNEKAYKVQELRIDSLETVLQQAEKALDADTSVLRKRAEKISFEINAIKLYHTDTIPRKLAFMLDDYNRIRKLYVHYIQSLAPTNEESVALHTQLSNLRKSLLKGKFKDEAFLKFYSIEKRDVEKQHTITTDLAGRISMADSTYNAIYPSIETVVKRIIPEQVRPGG